MIVINIFITFTSAIFIICFFFECTFMLIVYLACVLFTFLMPASGYPSAGVKSFWALANDTAAGSTSGGVLLAVENRKPTPTWMRSWCLGACCIAVSPGWQWSQSQAPVMPHQPGHSRRHVAACLRRWASFRHREGLADRTWAALRPAVCASFRSRGRGGRPLSGQSPATSQLAQRTYLGLLPPKEGCGEHQKCWSASLARTTGPSGWLRLPDPGSRWCRSSASCRRYQCPSFSVQEHHPLLGKATFSPSIVSFRTFIQATIRDVVVCHPSLQAGPRKVALQGLSNAFDAVGTAEQELLSVTGMESRCTVTQLPLGWRGLSRAASHAGLDCLAVPEISGGPRLGPRSSGMHLACVLFFFVFGQLVGLCRMFGFTHDFRHCVETLLPCALMCVCVLGDWMSLLFRFRFIFMSLCGVVSVCMSVFCLCVRFCGDVVKFFALARCVCVGVVQPKSTPAEKTNKPTKKARKDTSTPKSKKTKKMKTTITTPNYSRRNDETRNHENTETRKDKIMRQTTWATHTHTHATDNTMKTLRKHNIKINPKE